MSRVDAAPVLNLSLFQANTSSKVRLGDNARVWPGISARRIGFAITKVGNGPL